MTARTWIQRLHDFGATTAPNGCVYRMSTTQDDRPEVIREVPTGNMCARRDRIVGFCNTQFPSMDAARDWVIEDGRRTIDPANGWKTALAERGICECGDPNCLVHYLTH
jgi:hypothetical protein